MNVSKQCISRSPARGTAGAIAAARWASADAAARMLEQGGNAVDAAVAAGFVAGVVEPMETTLAGSGFMLVYDPADGITHSVEFAPRAPIAARPDMFMIDTARAVDRGLGVSIVVGDQNVQGIRAAGVPATLSGLAAAQARFGRLSLATVVAPAIRAAHDGFEADSYYALEVLANLSALRADPGAASLFLVDGDAIGVAHLGETTLGRPPRIRQEALGRTLELLAAQGIDAFHDGEIGDRLGQTVHELGGVLTRDDLRHRTTMIGPARRCVFRDHELWVPRGPAGAITQVELLNIWSALYPDGAPTEDDPERITNFASASLHAFADRYHWLGDPECVPVPEDGLLSDAYARSIAEAIRSGSPAPRAVPGGALPWELFASRAAHDPWAFEPEGRRGVPWRPDGATEPTAGTTHVSVIDRNGMAVSLTHTAANHFGSKVVCPRTGLLFDAAMGWFNARPNAANSIAGGKRPLANMGPMVLTKDGRATAAIGAPGGRRIISCVAQIAVNVVERHMTAADAIAAPRLDASGAVMLASEELSGVLTSVDPDALPWALVSQQHQPFSYELARPVVVTHDANGFEAATDPAVKGFALAF